MTFAEYGLAAVALFAAVLGFSQYVGPKTSSYKLSDDALEAYWLGFRVLKFEYSDIIDIRCISFGEMLVGSFFGGARNANNRPFAQYVLVVRRHGIYRSALLTPDNAAEFVAAVKAKCKINET